MQRSFLLIIVFHALILPGLGSSEFVPQTMGDACPGDELMYTCTVNGSGNTIWSGSAFDCETKMNEIILRHSQFSQSGSTGVCNGGAISARSLGVINDTFFSSQLNVTVNMEMNNKTIQCVYSFETMRTIGISTIYLATASPANVRLSEVHPELLTFTWTIGNDRLTGLNFIVNSTCGTCPTMTNKTMVTCSGFTLSSTPTSCIFSVRRVACDTIGIPSPPVMVTLAVPQVPTVKVIPQYSLNDNKQSLLTRIIVRVEQDITSFPITGYSIFYNSNMQNKTACVNNTCVYTVDLPPSICSTSDPNGADVAVSVAAVNVLGFGQLTESITIECNSQFARVEYFPVNTTFMCTFLNQSDSSPKSCSVTYGTCGKEMYSIQGNTRKGSPFVILNSSDIRPTESDCYIITASNGTYEIVVNGSINLPVDERAAPRPFLIAIITFVLVLLLGGIVVTIGVILYWRRSQCGNRASDGVTGQKLEMKEPEEDSPQHDNLYPINSKHFTESALTSERKLSKFRKKNQLKENDLIFLEYNFEPNAKRAKYRDVILKYKNGKLSTGPYAQDLVNNGKDLSEWESVFVLPHGRIKQKLPAGTRILYQNPEERRANFKVLAVETENLTLTDFMNDKSIPSTERKQVFVELSPEEKVPPLSLLHYVEVATIDDSKKLDVESVLPLDCEIYNFYTVLKAPGEHIKHPGKRIRVFIQGTASSLEQKSLTVGSPVLFKVIDKAGTALSVDDHMA